jgi:hypothetical protein
MNQLMNSEGGGVGGFGLTGAMSPVLLTQSLIILLT